MIKKAAGCSPTHDDHYHVSGSPASCKKYPLLFALCICILSLCPQTRAAAFESLPEVWEIGSHLFLFMKLYYQIHQKQKLKKPGWGGGFRKAIHKWYLQNDAMWLARQVTKYRKRYRWNHKKILKLAHIKPPNPDYDFVFKYIMFGLERARADHPGNSDVKDFLESVEYVRKYDVNQQDAGDYETLLEKIHLHELMWEHLKTPMLKSPGIWQAIVRMMPPHALIRNLGRLSRLNMLSPGDPNETVVVERLESHNALEKAKVHPLTVLTALCQYKNGMSHNGKRRWPVNERVVQGLWSAFNKTCASFSETGKNLLVAINVNTTMRCPVVGSPALSSKETAFALAKLIHEAESGANNPYVKCVTFYRELEEIDLSRREAARELAADFRQETHRTDGSLPFQYAEQHGLGTEGFIIFTDFLESSDKTTILAALNRYRHASGIANARLVVVGLSNSDFCITGGDENVMDVAGVDISALNRMMAFLAGTPRDVTDLLGQLTVEPR